MAFVVIHFQFFFLRNILDSTMTEWRTSCWWTAFLEFLVGTYLLLCGSGCTLLERIGLFMGRSQQNVITLALSNTISHLYAAVKTLRNWELLFARTLQICKNYGIPSTEYHIVCQKRTTTTMMRTVRVMHSGRLLVRQPRAQPKLSTSSYCIWLQVILLCNLELSENSCSSCGCN